MISRKNKSTKYSGSTLVSSMIAVAIIMIALIGTSQTEANRIALLLCETWRGIKGDPDYNPVTDLNSNLMISSSNGPDSPDGFTSLGSYTIKLGINNANEEDKTYHISYYATLSWKDIEPGLRMLNVNISWAQKDSGVDGFENTDKSFSLTFYTETL